MGPMVGADQDRTGDLLLAKQALSQLSYSPGSKIHISRKRVSAPVCIQEIDLVLFLRMEKKN